MAKKDELAFLLQSSQFEVDLDGYFSGSADYQLTNIPDEGLFVQAYLEMKREKQIALISEVSEGYLTPSGDTIYVSISGMVDGNALPDTFTLHYRLFKKCDQIEATPTLPSSFGEQTLSISPKKLLGGKKWKAGGGREILSVSVHNDNGDFSVSTNVIMGSRFRSELGLVAEYKTDDVSENYVVARSSYVSQKNQYVSGAENLSCTYRFFKPEKWSVLNKFNPLDVSKG